MEMPFALALERGKTLKLADLNSGFTRPDTIALAYFEASLLVDHIVRTYGDAKLQALVSSYGEGLEGNAAIEKRVGVTLPESASVVRQGARHAIWFDSCGASRRFPAPRRRPARRGGRARRWTSIGLRAAARRIPATTRRSSTYGQALAAAGDRAAFEPLEKAAALVPGSHRRGESARGDGASGRAAGRHRARDCRVPRAARAGSHRDRGGAAARRARGEDGRASRVLMQAYDRDRGDRSIRSRGARRSRAARAQGTISRRPPSASSRRRWPSGRPTRRRRTAISAKRYLLANRPAEAKAEALAALEIAPELRSRAGAAAALHQRIRRAGGRQ